MAERLTKRDENGNAYYDFGYLNSNHWTQGKHIDRLAAYEDTGLTPEEIKQMCALARLNSNIFDNDFGNHIAELIVAEQDGRLVTLPCKVGDMVYVTIRGYIEETEVRTLFFGHPSYSGGAPDPHYYRIRCENLDLRWDAIGKTVFLTREAAEKALEAKP